jgi:hypothetical protein
MRIAMPSNVIVISYIGCYLHDAALVAVPTDIEEVMDEV